MVERAVLILGALFAALLQGPFFTALCPGWGPHLVLVLSLIAALAYCPNTALWLAFWGGLFLDVLNAQTLGWTSLILTVLIILVIWVSRFAGGPYFFYRLIVLILSSGGLSLLLAQAPLGDPSILRRFSVGGWLREVVVEAVLLQLLFTPVSSLFRRFESQNESW